ncbi:mitochondrial 50S ribosomal protein L22 [Mycena floridula]|nr:mitochondrial 50S ribosomal protein L22 [Mycena floridula]
MQRVIRLTRPIPLVGPLECRRHASFKPLKWAQDKFKRVAAQRPKVRTEETKASKVRSQQEGTASLFAKTVEVKEPAEAASSLVKAIPRRRKKQSEHRYSTPLIQISHRKLNMLGQQISGKPIDHAILQMHFSEKRVSTRLKSMLETAKAHAIRYKGMDPSKLIVAQSWVDKGKVVSKKMMPFARGHNGIVISRNARMKVILKEGKTHEEKKLEARAYKLKKIVSAAMVREDRPIRNPGAMWAW